MKEYSLTSFSTHLAEMAANTVLSLNAGLHAAATVIEKDAKDRIGHYQESSGPFPAWEPLADSTEEEKERLGYPLDAPLERTGELRNSIEHEVAGLEAVVGSKSDKALWHEFGTDRIPPRPFIGPAAFENKEKIEGILGAATVRGLSLGGAIPSTFYDHELTNALTNK
jgi:HK97 gp10 family phage protein